MTHNELIALIEAHRDGKTLQWRDTDNSWQLSTVSIVGLLRNLGAMYKYRIKPEPREWYLYDCGSDVLHAATPEQQMENQFIDAIKVREVLE